jgi:hypothetical protein
LHKIKTTMIVRFVATLVALMFCFTGYAQMVFTDGEPRAAVKKLLADPYFKMKDGLPANQEEVVRTQTAAALLGAFCSKWEDDYSFPVTYKIVSIVLRDTLYEKDELRKIVAMYEDTNGAAFATIRYMKEQIGKAEGRYKSGAIDEATYKSTVADYSKMIADKLKSIEATKAPFVADYNKASATKIVKIVTIHTVVVNDLTKEIEVDYSRSADGKWESNPVLSDL